MPTGGFTRTSHCVGSAGSGVSRSPRPSTSAQPPGCKKNGTSEPSCAARSARRSSARRRRQSVFRPRSAAAASELPPPSPAATGTRLVSVRAAPSRTPVARRSRSAARHARFPGPCNSGWLQRSVMFAAGAKVSSSASEIACTTEQTSWYPSGRRPSTSKVRLTFAGAWSVSNDESMQLAPTGGVASAMRYGQDVEILPYSVASAADQIVRSEALLRAVAAGEAPATLRWYGYDARALILGVGQHASLVDERACRAAGVVVVKRTSGGGIVFAGPDLLALDIVLPAGHPLAGTD